MEANLHIELPSEEWFSTFLEHFPDAVVVKNRAGIIVFWSKLAEERFGYSAKKAVGQNAKTLLKTASAQPWDEIQKELLEKGFWEGDLLHETSSKHKIWMRSRQTVQKNSKGEPLLFIDVSTPIESALEKQSEVPLVDSEIKLRTLIQSNVVGILVSSLSGEIFEANDYFLNLLGYTQQDLKAGLVRWDQLTPLEYLPEDWRNIEEARTRRHCSPYEKAYFNKQGRRVPVLIAYALLQLDKQELAVCYVVDLSAQKKVEQKLRESEEHFRMLADSMPQIVWTALPNGEGDYFNRRWYQYTGSDPATPIVDSWLANLHPEDLPKLYQEWQRAMAAGSAFHLEYRLRENSTGLYRWHLARALPARDTEGQIRKWYGTCTDIQSQKEVESELRVTQEKLIQSKDRLELAVLERTQDLSDALLEKEALLKEVHHRVKNNLNVISSLLSLQAAQIKDPVYAGAFEESKSRVRSIALLHEKLYQSKNLAFVSFDNYLKEITQALFATFGKTNHLISLDVQAEGVSLPIDTAIPCGLIVNELISNSLKHAFAEGQRGHIQVLMTQRKEQIVLEVQDNGKGLSANTDIRNSGTLGLQLVSTLARQLGATLEQLPTPGAGFRIAFEN